MSDRDCACVRPHPWPEDEFRQVVSVVAPGLAVSGQPRRGEEAPPRTWEAIGVQRVIDVTDEGTPFTHPVSALSRVWLPTPDDGSPRDPAWFASVVRAAGDASVLVHCHMGVARAPSAALAILLARGWNEIEAIETVLFARPIASVEYAADALRWWLGADVDEDRVARMEARRHELVGQLRDRLIHA